MKEWINTYYINRSRITEVEWLIRIISTEVE